MNDKLLFNWRDLLSILRRAFSLKKILSLVFLGFIALLVYNLFSWGAAYLVKNSFQDSAHVIEYWWYSFGFLPDFSQICFPWYGAIIYYLGIILSWIILAMGMTAAARVTFQEFRGDYFFSSLDAIKYAIKNWKRIVLSPLLIIILLAMITTAGLIEALIFKIPYLGELFNSFMLIFILPFSLIWLFIAVVFVVSLRYTPSVTASIEEDFFEIVYQIFSSVSAQPARLLGYAILTTIQALAGFFIWSAALYQGFQIFIRIFSLVDPGKTFLLVNNAYYLILKLFPVLRMLTFNPILAPLHYIASPQSQSWLVCSWSMTVSSWLLACFLLFILLAAVSYLLSVVAVGDTISYLIIRYKKDDDDLVAVPGDKETDLESELEKAENKDDPVSEGLH